MQDLRSISIQNHWTAQVSLFWKCLSFCSMSAPYVVNVKGLPTPGLDLRSNSVLLVPRLGEGMGSDFSWDTDNRTSGAGVTTPGSGGA